ncbi:Sepiapterin reductase, partial [Pseudolycoriella hygida]
MSLIDHETLAIDPGASRGIGQAMAIENSSQMLSGSVVVLLARSCRDLEKTKEQILSRNPSLQVDTYSLDLAEPSIDEIKQCLQLSLDKSSKNFELAYIIHNVGSIGDETKKVIVNITSKCGIVPFESFALYSSGKAAREMFFKVLALEEKDVLVLNYSPGPIDTDMTIDVQANSCSPDIQNMFKSLRDENTILTPLQTTKRFLEILGNGNYNSGDHVDYYD